MDRYAYYMVLYCIIYGAGLPGKGETYPDQHQHSHSRGGLVVGPHTLHEKCKGSLVAMGSFAVLRIFVLCLDPNSAAP